MSRKLSLAVTPLTFVSLPFSNAALAGIGDNGAGVADLLKQSSPIEKAQYYSFDDDNYCWYDEGWEGPGWYWCGYEGENGIGWGGPYDWNGWGGGGRFRSRHPHGVGTWHAGSPNKRLGGEGGAGSASPRQGQHIRGLPGVHSPGSEVRASPSPHFGGEPTIHDFGGGRIAPQPFHSFGEGGIHSFGGGGFQGGFGGGEDSKLAAPSPGMRAIRAD